MLNRITIMGRICREIELRRTNSGVAVASFTVACDRDYGKGGEKQTDFIDCVAWRQTGEFISKNFTKGRMILVDGRLELRDWTDKAGNKRRTAEINVANAYFGDSKKDGAESQQTAYSGSFAPENTANFEMLDDEDTLPF